MNIYIPIAIVFVTMLFIIIRFFGRYKVDAFQAITFNYFTACLCAFFANYTSNLANINLLPQCLLFGMPIGILFIVIFYLMSLVTQSFGVAITSVLSKMSVVIPIAAGVWLYNEKLDALRITGIVIALVAVYLTSLKERSAAAPTNLKKLILLLVFFIGSGLVDTSIKYVQATRMTASTENLYIIGIFGSAGMFGILKTMYNYFKKGSGIYLKNIIGGIVLGSFNFYSLFFVIKALQFPGAKSSITFAVINIGVLITAALCGLIFFREKFSSINYAGFLMALIAIVLLSV